MADPLPLSTLYMEAALETRPTVTERTGPKIGDRYLPIRAYPTYRIAWDKIRDYAPMGGAFALEDLPDTLDELDFETYQSDVMHWGTRMTLSPKQLMFLRYAGQPQVVNAGDLYGVGPAADEQRSRDSDKIAKYTRYMNTALENVQEYLRMWALQGHIKWPPQNNGVDIAAAALPLSMGRQKIEHSVPFVAADAVGGGFHQNASGLTGVTGGPSATGVAWDESTANVIKDMAVISDLLSVKMRMNAVNLLVLMDRQVMMHLSDNTNVLNWILGTNRDREFMTIGDLRDFIKTKFEWEIEFYNSAWEYVAQNAWDDTKPPINTVQFMPTGTTLIFPRPEIQRMGVLATAPAPGPAHNWQAGKYMWFERQTKPPWKTQMGMGAFWFPLVFDPDVRFKLNAWT